MFKEVSNDKNAENKTGAKPFSFKKFTIQQDRCTMKVGTDGVLLGAWVDITGVQKILDIGSGTGVIAIMLAQKTVETAGIVHAVEIEDTAFSQAQENIQQSPFAKQLQIFHQSIQDFAKNCIEKYDLIVSNPPFFTGGTFSNNQEKNNVRHTVKLSHSDLLNATRSLLQKNGKFCVILPLIEGMRFIEIASTYGFFCTKRTDIRTLADKPVERLLLEFEISDNDSEKKQEKDELIMLNSSERNDYSDAYKNLTQDFYTIF
jgi:tRNA1Val (adenine37-N6)-methyltransferase